MRIKGPNRQSRFDFHQNRIAILFRNSPFCILNSPLKKNTSKPEPQN
ncbi:hypothetical protein ELI_2385 [Eubacterium callanderi]|uniref:Uncharacterized protein n=1 Tax=Eubacterium callanderi TaxID=53442 RepID=E3GDY5_9FIRM|nr:hypothetical protein ELI_2385 [Eubacterium callanderi]